MTRVALGLGSNEGDSLTHLRNAVSHLEALGEVQAVSSLYETDPVGGPPQASYLNAVAVLETEFSPLDLLDRIRHVEQSEGRVRRERWGSRTLDIDIVVYGDDRIDLPSLQIPHPRAKERRFVLEPLAEVWPEAEVNDGLSAREALEEVQDQRAIRWEGDWLTRTPSRERAARLWVAAQIVGLALYAGALAAGHTTDLGGLTLMLGAVLALGGLGLAGWALLALGAELSPYPQPLPDAELVERGPYRIVRHPIYGGIALALIGVAIAAESLGGLVAALGMAVFFHRKLETEERALRIGVPGYGEYQQRVKHRLVPFLW